MDFIEGKSLRFNVVARNAAGRVLAAPVTVTFNGAALTPAGDGSFEVNTNGTLEAVSGEVRATEPVGIVLDNKVASLTFVQVDGTLGVVEVPVGA